MKKMLSLFVALNLTLSVANNLRAADTSDSQGGDSKSQSSDSSQAPDEEKSQDSGDSKSKVEIRPGVDLSAKGVSGVNAGGGTVKVAPKGTATASVEPYIAVGGKSVDVKIKGGATVGGQATNDDVKTDDHRDKSDASIGVHGGASVAYKDYIKVEGKGGHVWTAESGQYNFIQGIVGGCSSSGKTGEKFQLCINGYLTKNFYEQYKTTEVAGELFIQKKVSDGTKVFAGPRYAYEKSESGAPDTHFVGIGVGVTFDANPGASSKK